MERFGKMKKGLFGLSPTPRRLPFKRKSLSAKQLEGRSRVSEKLKRHFFCETSGNGSYPAVVLRGQKDVSFRRAFLPTKKAREGGAGTFTGLELPPINLGLGSALHITN
jgi:hypothetical protein